MVFKGVVDTTHALPDTHKAGWQYKVGEAGTYAGVVCEAGDSITCIADGTVASNADWYVTQANIDGAVIGPSNAVDGHIPTFNGTSGKIIQDGYAITSQITNNSESIPTAAAVWAAVLGGIKIDTGTISTSTTSATVNFSGTNIIGTYATMSGSEVLLDITRASNNVVFSTASVPNAEIICAVVSM